MAAWQTHSRPVHRDNRRAQFRAQAGEATMIDASIFQPAIALVVLTFAVSVRLLFVRIGTMRRERIHPQSVATSGAMAARITDTRVADNFRNLFELPVLFYLASLVAAVSGLVTPAVLALAWAFVALRIAHSAIHCTYNKVMHRFYAYIAGWAVLVALWAVIAVGLFAR
jgi:hypothetical protein